MTKRLLLYFSSLVFLAVSGCFKEARDADQKKWELHPDDPKQPYGDYLAFSSLKYFFPDATIEALPQNFRYSSMDNRMKYNFTGHSLLVLEGLDFYLSDEEWKDLKTFIDNGNEVVLFCSRLDSKIEQELGCYKERRSEEEQIFYEAIPGKENEEVLTIAHEPDVHYGYQGRSIKGYFSPHTDSVNWGIGSNTNYLSLQPDTLGFANGKPDFLRFKSGNGHLTLHAAPWCSATPSCCSPAMKIISPQSGRPCLQISTMFTGMTISEEQANHPGWDSY